MSPKASFVVIAVFSPENYVAERNESLLLVECSAKISLNLKLALHTFLGRHHVTFQLTSNSMATYADQDQRVSVTIYKFPGFPEISQLLSSQRFS